VENDGSVSVLRCSDNIIATFLVGAKYYYTYLDKNPPRVPVPPPHDLI
jgi:hypothetical protein